MSRRFWESFGRRLARKRSSRPYGAVSCRCDQLTPSGLPARELDHLSRAQHAHREGAVPRELREDVADPLVALETAYLDALQSSSPVETVTTFFMCASQAIIARSGARDARRD